MSDSGTGRMSAPRGDQGSGPHRQVFLVTSGGGGKMACDDVENGSYSTPTSPTTARPGPRSRNAIADAAADLRLPAAIRSAPTPAEVITKETLTPGSCWTRRRGQGQRPLMLNFIRAARPRRPLPFLSGTEISCRMSASEVYARWRYRASSPITLSARFWPRTGSTTPSRSPSDSRRRSSSASTHPAFLPRSAACPNTARELGEFIFLTLGMTVVMLAGGIDLSVGSTFALRNFATLALFNWLGWPIGAAVALAPCSAAPWSACQRHPDRIPATARIPDDARHADHHSGDRRHARRQLIRSGSSSPKFESRPSGTSLATTPSTACRSHSLSPTCGRDRRPCLPDAARASAGILLAVGGSRRSAHNAGLSVRRTVAATYVISGVLAGPAASSSPPGLARSAAPHRRRSRGHRADRGGAGRQQPRRRPRLRRQGAARRVDRHDHRQQPGASRPAQRHSSLVLGIVLMIAVAIDVRWLKNRSKVLSRVYVSPAYFRLPPRPATDAASGSPYAVNDKLRMSN